MCDTFTWCYLKIKPIFQNYKDCGEYPSVQYDVRIFTVIAITKGQPNKQYCCPIQKLNHFIYKGNELIDNSLK